jgi:uncharacterized protein (DUF885 family)
MSSIGRFLLILFLAVSCTSLRDKEDDPRFAELTQKFLDEFWEVHPGYASQLGLEKYDSVLEIPDEKNRAKRVAFYQKYVDLFEDTPVEDLSFSQRTDRELILNELEGSLWSYNKFRSFEWNPAAYNIGSAVSSVLEKDKRPINDRIKDLSEKLLKAPQYYQTAINSIKKPTKEHTRLAIKQTKGLVKYLKGDVKKQVNSSTLSAREKRTARQRVDAAAAAAKRYRFYLQSILASPKKVGGLRSFRIGPELYAKKFEYDLQVGKTPKELYREALATKEDIRSKMFETAIELYPKYFGEKLPPKDRQDVIKSVIDKVAKNHAKPDEFVETVRKQIPELEKFIKEKDLVVRKN